MGTHHRISGIWYGVRSQLGAAFVSDPALFRPRQSRIKCGFLLHGQCRGAADWHRAFGLGVSNPGLDWLPVVVGRVCAAGCFTVVQTTSGLELADAPNGPDYAQWGVVLQKQAQSGEMSR